MAFPDLALQAVALQSAVLAAEVLRSQTSPIVCLAESSEEVKMSRGGKSSFFRSLLQICHRASIRSWIWPSTATHGCGSRKKRKLRNAWHFPVSGFLGSAASTIGTPWAPAAAPEGASARRFGRSNRQLALPSHILRTIGRNQNHKSLRSGSVDQKHTAEGSPLDQKATRSRANHIHKCRMERCSLPDMRTCCSRSALPSSLRRSRPKAGHPHSYPA
mmetsp:Transcript_66677/g.144817  ORF Transcript_66677/g.144817 Transcript_66677/m.144817 type:complete len:217 (+) Transcript_66677:879-1529(+)